MSRRLLTLIACSLAFGLLAPAAEAQTQLYGAGYRPWMDRCLKKSLVPTPETSIEIIRVSDGRSWVEPWRDGRLALDRSGSRREDCQVLLHEVGHLFDWAVLSPSERRLIGCQVFRASPDQHWWSFSAPEGWVKGSESESGPLEWFAESYKLAATLKSLPRGRNWQFKVPTSAEFAYGVEEVIDRRRLAQVRRVIVKAAARPADRSERDQRTSLSC